MSHSACPNEQKIIDAARLGLVTSEHESHLSWCASCREAYQLCRSLQQLLAIDDVSPAPDPQRLWLKAAFAERQRKSALISRIAAGAYAALFGAVAYSLASLAVSMGGDQIQKSLNEMATSPSLVHVLTILLIIIAAFVVTAPSVRRSR